MVDTLMIADLRERMTKLEKRVQRIETRNRRAGKPINVAAAEATIEAHFAGKDIPVIRQKLRTVADLTPITARVPRMRGGVPGYPVWYQLIGGDYADSDSQAVTPWMPLTSREDTLTIPRDPDWPPFVAVIWSWDEERPS